MQRPRRRCEGTAMGAISLDLRPGVGIGPFTLGMPICEAFAQVEQDPKNYDVVHVKYFDEEPLKLDIVISLPDHGFHLRFDPWSQVFLDRIKEWWKSFVCEGRPDYILAFKLKALKDKLREWSKTIQGNLAMQKQSIVGQLVELEEKQDQRLLSEEEIHAKAGLLIKFENIAKHEEIAWRQRSRVNWLKQGEQQHQVLP
ncbi:hypothetical protein FXO37_14583 [Capsicum annuum]|nr:hypothetical protein FXO37_14583 [Capsicum annuum]